MCPNIVSNYFITEVSVLILSSSKKIVGIYVEELEIHNLLSLN